MPLVWKGAKLGGSPTCPCNCTTGDPANPCDCNAVTIPWENPCWTSVPNPNGSACGITNYQHTINVAVPASAIVSSGSERRIGPDDMYNYLYDLLEFYYAYYGNSGGQIYVSPAACPCRDLASACVYGILRTIDNDPTPATIFGHPLETHPDRAGDARVPQFTITVDPRPSNYSGLPCSFLDGAISEALSNNIYNNDDEYSAIDEYSISYPDGYALSNSQGANVFPDPATGYDPAISGINLQYIVYTTVGMYKGWTGCRDYQDQDGYVYYRPSVEVQSATGQVLWACGCDCCKAGLTWYDSSSFVTAGYYCAYGDFTRFTMRDCIKETRYNSGSGYLTIDVPATDSCCYTHGSIDIYHWGSIGPFISDFNESEYGFSPSSGSTSISVNGELGSSAPSYTQYTPAGGIFLKNAGGDAGLAVKLSALSVTAFTAAGLSVAVPDAASGTLCAGPTACSTCVTTSSYTSSLTLQLPANTVAVKLGSVKLSDMFKNLSYDPLATGTFADTIGTDILLSAKAIVGRLKSVRADVNDAWGAWVQDSDCSPPSGEKNGEQVSAEVSGASYVHNGVFPNIGYLQSSGPSYYDADTCAAGLTSPELALKRTVLCYGAFGASDLAAAITAATTLHP